MANEKRRFSIYASSIGVGVSHIPQIKGNYSEPDFVAAVYVLGMLCCVTTALVVLEYLYSVLNFLYRPIYI